MTRPGWATRWEVVHDLRPFGVRVESRHLLRSSAVRATGRTGLLRVWPAGRASEVNASLHVVWKPRQGLLNPERLWPL